MYSSGKRDDEEHLISVKKGTLNSIFPNLKDFSFLDSGGNHESKLSKTQRNL